MDQINSQFRLLGNAMHFAEQNHRVISQNIANLNTPRYQTKEVRFDDLLARLENGQTNEEAAFGVQNAEGLSNRADGNNVDLDNEIGKLKKNAVAYQAMVQILGSKIGLMNRAING